MARVETIPGAPEAPAARAARAARAAPERQRWLLLLRLERLLEGPISGLGLIWLGLVVVELANGPTPTSTRLVHGIWLVFAVDFLVRLALAPRRARFLLHNLLTVASLLLPALRVFRLARVARILRVARLGRGATLVRIVASVNRGMGSLATALDRQGFAFVTALSGVVVAVGAAGMLHFEGRSTGLPDYGSAVWWTAMLVITHGTDFWPRTVEGRVLGFGIALYGVTVIGYLTATLAVWVIGPRDRAVA